MAKIASQAEMISCWPIEYAVASLAEAEPESAAEFIAWVTPTPPGMAETLLETELEAVTVATFWKATGIEFRQALPKNPRRQHEQDDRADEQQDHQRRVVGEETELDREGAADREEQIEVEPHVEDGEGDLLDDQAGEDEREGRARDQRGEHRQHHEGAEVGRKEPVERDRDRVGGEHEAEGKRRPRQRRAQDPVPGERREARLRGLQQHPGHDRPGGHLADLVEEVGDPGEGGYADQLEQAEQERTPPSQSPIRVSRRATAAP